MFGRIYLLSSQKRGSKKYVHFLFTIHIVNFHGNLSIECFPKRFVSRFVSKICIKDLHQRFVSKIFGIFDIEETVRLD